jgi:hypothetical protein
MKPVLRAESIGRLYLGMDKKGRGWLGGEAGSICNFDEMRLSI